MYEQMMTIRVPMTHEKTREEMMFIGGIIVGIAAMLFITFAAILIQKDRRAETVTELNQQITTLQKELTDQQLTAKKQLAAAQKETNTIQAEYDKLVADTAKEDNATFSTMAKYWYVLKEAPTNGGLSLGMIQEVDDLCKEKNINPHIVFSIVDVESDYNTNADNNSSSARGLGQILGSTAKSIYENFMGNGAGTYTHNMAYNGYTNLEILINYLSYLKTEYNGDITMMLSGYSGGQSAYFSWYASEMNQYNHDPYSTNYQ